MTGLDAGVERAAARPELHVVDLGRAPYGDVLELQRSIAARRVAREIDHDVLLLVEHPHVVTLGRAYKGVTLTASPELLRSRGIEVFEVERGGDVTYHGPGQLVGYPIFDLKQHRRDLHWYLRQVEEALIAALRTYGLTGSRRAGYTGVWLEGTPGPGTGPSPQGRKIASIGVHARDWVTWHGFALNVTTDLSYFDLMVPCGIAAVQMTSIAAERPDSGVDTQSVATLVSTTFAEVFEHKSMQVSFGADRVG